MTSPEYSWSLAPTVRQKNKKEKREKNRPQHKMDGTRIQHCSLCKNHGLQKLKKKHQCKYKVCNCYFCDLTKRCQKAMRHQQRLWRHQKNVLKKSGSKDIKGQVCDRCRNHDTLIQKKDHTCPWANCECKECYLNYVRKELMKYQQRVRRSNVTEASTELDSPPPTKTPEQEPDATNEEQESEPQAPLIEPPPQKQEQDTPPPTEVPLWPPKSPSPSKELLATPMELPPSPVAVDSSQECPKHSIHHDSGEMEVKEPRIEPGPASSPPPLIQLKWPPYSYGLPYPLPPEMPPSFMPHSHVNSFPATSREFDSLFNFHRHKAAAASRPFLDSYPFNRFEDFEMRALSPTEGIKDVPIKKFSAYNPALPAWEGLPTSKYVDYEHSRRVRNCDMNVPSSIISTFNFYLNKSKPNLHRPIPLDPRSPPKQPNILNRDIAF